jgi:predicted mannosyl-3-phosphoglycerate phosphatase (HAD superfamily)
VPFDEHRFQHIFSKLYNRLFVMEEYKYLPPKYSYSLKDLASDFGVFERADVASMISGSTNMSMTTASGFNVGFNNESSIKEKEISYPLSPIREQRSRETMIRQKVGNSPLPL